MSHAVDLYDLLFPELSFFCPADQNDPKYLSQFFRQLFSGGGSYFDYVPDDPNAVSVETPGVCITSYFEYNAVKEQLELMAGELDDGTAYRLNDLGLFRLSNVPFMCSESPFSNNYCGIALGMPAEDHEIVRPFFDEILGDGSIGGNLSAESGNKWNRVDLIQSATEYLSTRATLDVGTDPGVWVIKEIHKVALGMELTDEEGRELVDLFFDLLTRAILPGWISFWFSWDSINTRRRYLERYEAAIRELIADGSVTTLADEGLNVKKSAWALFDAFCYAGLPSTRGTIMGTLGAYYNGLVDVDLTDPQQLGRAIFETVRQYPPVLGVPRANSETNRRHAPLVGMSGYDTVVFGEDALDYRIRFTFTDYENTLLNWANAATPKSGEPLHTNHVCPAMSFSFNVALSFLLALDPTQWTAESIPEVPLAGAGPRFWDSFTITKNTE